jgi:glycosyltransferase involved in cell wall biosynthesis
LASDIDGVREIVDHDRDGLLFDDNAEDQLATHIQHLLHCPDVIGRYAMQAHRSIVENELTWHRAAEQYQSVYRAAVSV